MTPGATLVLGLLTPLIAIGVLVPLWRGHPNAGIRWLLALAGAAALGVVLTLAGPWSFSSYYLRVLPLFAIAATLLRRWRQAGGGSPDSRSAGISAGTVVLAALAGGSIALALLVQRGLSAKEPAVGLAFPLRHGTFVVLQGGNSVLLNPFHARGDSSGRLAIDLVRLNGHGGRARRFLPRTLTDYEVFGDTVYGPCPGVVMRAISFHADEFPGVPNPMYPSGNHVVLACGDTLVLLAHLMRSSLRVRAGDSVSVGMPLARVGNSGNTSEPHLHLQATLGTGPEAWRRGRPLAILIDGRFLVTNNLVRR